MDSIGVYVGAYVATEACSTNSTGMGVFIPLNTLGAIDPAAFVTLRN